MIKVSDEEFLEVWHKHGSPTAVAHELKMSVRNVLVRRRALESKLDIELKTINDARLKHHELADHPAITNIEVQDGVVLVASDAHYWPNIITTAHRAFVGFIKALQPKAIIMNGDVLDGSTISRHPPIGWEKRPSLIQEIETCQDRLAEIADACKNAKKIWTLGNHDARLETRLASVAPEFAKVRGVHLKDHFPMWQPGWACWINDSVVVKHRYKGGLHATHNNTLWAGKTMVTGHLHSLKVTPFSDYVGTRWGVDTGTLSECYGPQTVDYCETSPVNWRSGFAVLTFHRGKLLWPELVSVVEEGVVDFRGALHSI